MGEAETRTRLRLTRRGRIAAVGVPVVLAVVALGGGGGAAKLGTGAPPRPVVEVIDAEATFYGPGIPPDAVTADGTPFDPQAATAAHPTLPLGTDVRVTRPETGASLVVEVNDRLPQASSQRIDLTLGAAQVLGMVDAGRVPVTIEVLGKG